MAITSGASVFPSLDKVETFKIIPPGSVDEAPTIKETA
jgi:hypothetical protein